MKNARSAGRGRGSQFGRGDALAALAGVVAGGLTLGVGELVAVGVGSGSAPFLSVGDAFVDLTPEWLKSFAISTFGAHDKIVLLAGIAVVLIVLSAVAGVVELRHRHRGVVLVGLTGLVAVAAALTRPSATPAYALPTIAGTAAGVVALRLLIPQLAPEEGGALRETTAEARLRRRKFLLLATAAAGLGVLAAVGGGWLGRTAQDVRAARDRLRLPPPAAPAPPIPAGVALDVDGITAFRTPNSDFYRVDTALALPRVLPEEWRLRLHGMVEREVELDFEQLLRLGLVERMITLTCVSNEVGGELAGNARWLGYPIADLLARARPVRGADMLLSTSADGFTAGTPLDVLTDGRDALLAIGMNGEPLPMAHGFPARLVVPGLYGYVSATKWVVDMEVTRFDRASAYWTDRGWADRAPIKTASRIDVPGSFAKLRAGRNRVAGVAWAQHRGIDGVDVQVDDDPWAPAQLAGEASVDTWRQWVWEWDATPGNHTLRVRATDGDGQLQTKETVPPFPNGSSGWHSVVVDVS